MSRSTVPPNAAVPPGAGPEPPPGADRTSRPEDEEVRESAEADAEEMLDQDVAEPGHRLGSDDEAKAGRPAATGPLAPVRRHPLTAALAAAGTMTATLIGLKIARDHRKATRRYMRAARMRRKAAERRIGDARDVILSAAAELPHRRRSTLRRMVHR